MRGDEFGVIGDHHVVSQVEFIFVGDAVVGLGRLVAHARVADGGSAPAVTFADGGDGGAADLVVGGLVRVGLPLASRMMRPPGKGGMTGRLGSACVRASCVGKARDGQRFWSQPSPMIHSSLEFSAKACVFRMTSA